MVRETLETRWFFAGRLPAMTFRSSDQKLSFDDVEAESRVDRYLRQPLTHSSSLKIRHGLLELKWRLADPETIKRDGFVIELTSWAKWSWPAPLDANGSSLHWWLPVEKHRKTRRWLQTEKGFQNIAQEPEPEPDETFCDVEIVEIRLFGTPYWSLCFEASGPERRSFLIGLTDKYLKGGWDQPITAGKCQAYPAWLATQLSICKDSGPQYQPPQHRTGESGRGRTGRQTHLQSVSTQKKL